MIKKNFGYPGCKRLLNSGRQLNDLQQTVRAGQAATSCHQFAQLLQHPPLPSCAKLKRRASADLFRTTKKKGSNLNWHDTDEDHYIPLYNDFANLRIFKTFPLILNKLPCANYFCCVEDTRYLKSILYYSYASDPKNRK